MTRATWSRSGIAAATRQKKRVRQPSPKIAMRTGCAVVELVLGLELVLELELELVLELGLELVLELVLMLCAADIVFLLELLNFLHVGRTKYTLSGQFHTLSVYFVRPRERLSGNETHGMVNQLAQPDRSSSSERGMVGDGRHEDANL